MEPQNTLISLGENLATSAGVGNVFGEPIVAEGKTIVPVARIGYGFGARNGSGIEPAAGGGGAGARAVGVLEITSTHTRFIRFTQPAAIAALVGLGVLLGALSARRRGR